MSFTPKVEKPKSRRGTGASCKECRRLKVRCDREVPCGSCVRRGCSGICPDGQLSAVKSARYVLASTEELHQRIQTLTFRTHELEHALEITHTQLLQVQAQNSGESGSIALTSVHPMLEPHKKRIAKDPRERDSEDEDSMDGTLTRHEHEATTSDFGGVGEYGATIDAALEDVLSNIFSTDESPPNVPGAVSQNVAQFAYSSLPPKEEAWVLIDAYYEYAVIQYQPIPRTRTLSSLLIPAYTQDITTLSAVDLSSLYSLLTIGAFHNLKKPAFPMEARKWLALSQSLLLSQILKLDASVLVVEALMLLALAFLSTQKVDAVKAYHVTAIAMKCAQLIGLHKDSDDAMSSLTESTHRRHLFWELWSLDSTLALEFDRPPAMIKAFIQFDLPALSPETRDHDTLYLRWKYHLSSVSQEILTLSLLPSATNTPYTAVMVLDHKIRAARPPSLPHEIESSEVQGGVDLGELDVVRSIVMNGVSQATLLHLHRPYFAYAILRDDQSPMGGRMSPSVLACYNSAIEILNGAFQLLEEQPALVPRLGTVWPSYTISMIVLYSIAVLMPYWPNAVEATKTGDKAVKELFEHSSGESFKAQQAMPALLKLQSLAHNAMQRHAQGMWTHPSRRESPLAIPSNITPPRATSSAAMSNIATSFTGTAGPLNPGPRQIPALSATNYVGPISPPYAWIILTESSDDFPLVANIQAGPSRLSTPQVLSFSVPSSTEEPMNFSPGPSWDSLIRGIQTSASGSVGVAGLGPTDGTGFPSGKVLRMAWPTLLKKLGVVA